MSQTTYSQEMDVAVAGLEAYGGDYPARKLTRNNPSEEIDYGKGVVKITGDDDGVKLPSAGGDVFEGVALLDFNKSAGLYEVNSALNCMVGGCVYVTVDQTVTPDSSVYCRYAGRAQVQTIVFDADIITGNTVAGTVNGTAVSQAFTVDHLTTMTALAVLIAAVSGVTSAVVGGAGNRTITVTSSSHETDVTLGTFTVTGGVSQAGNVITETVNSVSDSLIGTFRGDADTSTALAVSGAKFREGAAAGGLAVLEINLP
jgi:hypothetical protein